VAAVDERVHSQAADGGGEGAHAERGEVDQSRQKHCVGRGGARQLQVALPHKVSPEHVDGVQEGGQGGAGGHTHSR